MASKYSFRTERYLPSNISKYFIGNQNTNEECASFIPEDLKATKLLPSQIAKNPSYIVNDFVDMMDGKAAKFNQIALWNGDGKINTLHVEVLDFSKQVIRAKINLVSAHVSNKFEKKILKMQKLSYLRSAEITFCCNESMTILLLLNAIANGRTSSISALETALKLNWMPSHEYAWTLAADLKCNG